MEKSLLKIKIIETLETIVDKELANELKGQLECLWENTEKYKAYSVPLEKATRKDDKDGNEDIKTISYKKKIIDSARFMASSLSNFADNLANKIHKI